MFHLQESQGSHTFDLPCLDLRNPGVVVPPRSLIRQTSPQRIDRHLRGAWDQYSNDLFEEAKICLWPFPPPPTSRIPVAEFRDYAIGVIS